MRYKRFFKMGLLSVALFLAGDKLQSIYGMDPPYVFYFGGYVLIIISYLLVLVTGGIIIIDIFKLLSSRK
jgi:hypothetical protein